MDSISIFEKIFRVIESCETKEQLFYAHRYLNLAEQNGYIAKEFKRAIYFDIFFRKSEELNYDTE